MSYITPSSYIYVLEGVPFDETYQHSIYFANTTAQYNYFYSKRKYTFNAQTYQRVKRGYCRVQQKADTMYGCNYMMFQNTNYGNKWFYAFILGVEYINDNVSEIHYEIDVLQSWLWHPASGSTEPDSGFDFNKCFIEREHTPTDNIGDNLVPEGLDIGDYIIKDYGSLALSSSSLMICIASTKGRGNNNDIVDVDGSMISGLYSGVRYNYVSDASNANQLISDIVDASGNDANSTILGVYMLPDVFLTMQDPDDPYTEETTIAKPYTNVDGYTVNNNKLFTYPYQMLCVDNGESIKTYNWEYFTTPNAPASAVLKFYGTVAGGGQYVIVPEYYKIEANNTQYNWNETMTGNISTQCAYNIDGYKAWLAQNQYTLPAQEQVIMRNYVSASRQSGYQTGLGLGSAFAGAEQGLQVSQNRPVMSWGYGGNQADTRGMQSGLAQAGQGFLNFLDARAQYQNAMDMLQATKDTATLKPHAVYGSNQGGIRLASGVWRPRYYNMHIRAEYARIIDGYFDRYGYACHKFKKPSLNNRPYWTYVKTVDCTIKGNIPNDDATQICKIFNSGITFWTNGSYVGNYALGDNRGNAPV